MNTEVLIVGEMYLKECKQILQRMLPGYKLNVSPGEQGDFILLSVKDVYCIFISSQQSVAELAQKEQYKTLSCGFSPYDTLVLSSSTADQALVSLQREIHTVSGRVLEAGDYLIHKQEDYPDMALLLCTAVLLLLDQKDSEFIF